MNFRREGVASRYAVQRVCTATADADAGAEGGVPEEEWAADEVGAGLGLEEVAVEACFGVLGPAIMVFVLFPFSIGFDSRSER
jgi:hypothetical protein